MKHEILEGTEKVVCLASGHSVGDLVYPYQIPRILVGVVFGIRDRPYRSGMV